MVVSPLFLLFLLIPLVNSQHYSDHQTTILLSLKQHWGNPPLLDSWNSNSIPCSWPQVGCSNGTMILYLSENNITGTIPSAICQLRNLVGIDLSRNKLSGRIPASLNNCSNLETLDLSMNVLSGTIPGELFRMPKLRYLHINGNRLFGGIPTPIEAFSLESIDLSNNHLNGSIPDDIRNLSNLEWLDLSMNSLSGSIPSGQFHMHQLWYISLANNNLTGEVPAELDLTSLRELNLSHNHLHGTIPSFHLLSSLDLSYNQLSGDIIQNVLNVSSRTKLRLCSNQFYGKIPLELVNRTSDENCFDHSNLCSENKTKGLPGCPIVLCSYTRTRNFLNCKPNPNKLRREIIAGAIGCGVVGFVVICYLARKCGKMAHMTFAARHKMILPLTDMYKEWEMVSFQKLDFDKFKILSSLTDDNLIGNGGSGKVYRVVIDQTGNTVAVKSIWNDKKSDERLEKEFIAEIQTLGTIRHYNIVKLLCYISGKDKQLLVYQYFEKKSLDQWLHYINKREISALDHSSTTKIDWPKRLHIAVGLAQGLCYMHHDCSPPIIHRDIKSSNILLDSEFNAKIADFGLAKMLSRRGDTETASAVAGTFGYIAPEYAYMDRVNVKSDVYSFGVVLLELTTGRKAVSRDDDMNLAGWAQMHYRETLNIVDLLDPQIKAPTSFMDQIVAVFKLGVMCTSESPSNRPSMRECLQILQDCSSHVPSSNTVTRNSRN